MAGPIVYVDHSEILAGQANELARRIGELAALVEAEEPRAIAYSAYLNDDRTEIWVVHVHPDLASLVNHFEVAGPSFRSFVELVRLRSIDVYGEVTDELVEQLRAKARLLGDATVAVHRFEAGFVRVREVAASRPSG